MQETLTARLLNERSKLLAYVRRKLSPSELAEDVLQDSLLAALRAAPVLHDETKLLPWFYRILKALAAHTNHGGHGGHGVDHTGHEAMFRRKFWVSLALSVPVLVYSDMLQMWLGYTPPTFLGSAWIGPLFAVIVFVYGGWPFIDMAMPELRQRQPGMMTLISLTISVAFVYSVAALFLPDTPGFFWDLVTLIDIMLLGHWLEMRSVRQASGALNELAKLMPDTAERLRQDGSAETVAVSDLRNGDVVLVRPGESVSADGEVIDGRSAVNEAMITGESMPVEKEEGSRVIAGTINGDGS
jgi:Cu2+-exporting ATPase